MTARDHSNPQLRLSARRSLFIFVATAHLMACADTERTESPHVAKQSAAVAIDTQDVRSATYMSQFTESGFITLTAGKYESDEPEWRVVAGLDKHIAIGDLDGGTTVESAVVIWTNTGGTGTFIDLAILALRDGEIVNIATRFLGDRLRIHALSIVEREIVLDATMHTPDDPMCCPSLRVTRRFRLDQGGLTEQERPVGAMDYGSPNGDLIE